MPHYEDEYLIRSQMQIIEDEGTPFNEVTNAQTQSSEGAWVMITLIAFIIGVVIGYIIHKDNLIGLLLEDRERALDRLDSHEKEVRNEQ